MNVEELNYLVNLARDKQISASAFDEIYNCLGGDYISILNFLREI